VPKQGGGDLGVGAGGKRIELNPQQEKEEKGVKKEQGASAGSVTNQFRAEGGEAEIAHTKSQSRSPQFRQHNDNGAK